MYISQAVAWTTAAYPFGVPNQIPTRDTGLDSGLDREPVKERTSPRSPRWAAENLAKFNRNERKAETFFVLRLNFLCGYKRWIWGFS